MSNTDILRDALHRPMTERPGYGPQAHGARTARVPFSPLLEQAMLFTFFAGAAGFWVAMIWWIVR
jgi:hypothetical protein